MIIKSKRKSFANKTPSLSQDISNKQKKKKYQMRIIRIFTRSWAWQGVEKLKCCTAFFRILGVGVANALTRPVPIFTISTARFFAGFFQFSAVAL